MIKMDFWGKDHWSLLAYCAWSAIDYKGVLEVRRMRADGIKYPTVLKNGVQEHHNDFDCLDDLEGEGLIKNVGTGISPAIVITEKGWDYILKLFKHKAADGSFSNFVNKQCCA